MDSLFDKKYENTQPLRKIEPLIRFDLDGKPQPRRPIGATSVEVVAPKVELAAPTKPTKPMLTHPAKPAEDLKRKLNEPPSQSEPKKKQPKQQSIMSFFKAK